MSEPDVVRLDYPDASIHIRVTSDMERRYRARSCRKEPWTVDWLQQHVQAGDVLYDVGANVGTFTLIAAIGRGARVVAFEPGYANYARLCENLALNRCSGAVIPVPLPLNDVNGLFRFLYRTIEPGQSRHKMKVRPWEFTDGSTGDRDEQTMCGVRLDDLRVQFGLPPPAHIKLDVDGAEVRVLRGALETLRHEALRSVLVEADVALWDEVRSLLTECGFAVASQVMREGAPTYAVFARRAGGAEST